jgi:hypothetical protein
VRIEVSDASPQRPVPRPYDTDAPTGHGILLVERLARRWGIDSHDDGKTVWFEVALSAYGGNATAASEIAMQP